MQKHEMQKEVPSDYQWHYDPTPLHKLQELVDGLDWISETYIFGGYARALLGYPPFPEREKFGPGHDIDFVISPKYPEALEMMRKEGIQPWEGFTKHMSLEKAWEWHEKEIKKGFLPIPIMNYMLEKQEKIGPYYLSWGWETHLIDFETDMPIIRIKPKPLIVYQRSNSGSPALVEPAKPLTRLFELQTQLIEHKFPINRIAEHEYQLSNAGDIFRSMTERFPDYGYIGGKLESLGKYFAADNTGDFREYKELMAMPHYKAERDKYLRNLAELKVLTVKAYIDLKRKDVMLDALELARGIVLWFESLKPYRPPKRALEKLTDSLERFFPVQFREETLTPGSMPGSNPAGPVVPYLAVPVVFTVVLVVVSFVGWVASQLDHE